jgi:copper chaperone CopZ
VQSTLIIDGMRTVHCTRAVFQALALVPGVTRAEVSMGRADVEHGVAIPDAAFASALAVVGYRVRARLDGGRSLTVLGEPPEGP